jgi:four helix bundle protein
MNEKKENMLLVKSFSFAIRIVKLYQYLVAEKKEYVLSKQLLRSGTAVGALIREAQNAESKADFIHKLGIAQKECDFVFLQPVLITGGLRMAKSDSKI